MGVGVRRNKGQDGNAGLEELTKEEDNLPVYKMEDLKLPKKFAEQVLELEICIEQDQFNIKQLQRLMVLYSKAVEFYNGKSDDKYLFYHNKIQSLITQPKILNMLSEKAIDGQSKPQCSKVETDLKTKEMLKQKERLHKMNLHISNQELEKQDLKTKIIEDHSSAQDQESKIITSNLSEQSDSLKKRLEMRK